MYRGNKKFARKMRRLHNERKDKPRQWWQDDDYVWEPAHVETARKRAHWRRAEVKRAREGWTGYGGYRWYNDFGVARTARKRKHHRRHEIKRSFVPESQRVRAICRMGGSSLFRSEPGPKGGQRK